jgi:hypothetical protein
MEAVRHKVKVADYDENLEEPAITEPLDINHSEKSNLNKIDEIDLILQKNMLLES